MTAHFESRGECAYVTSSEAAALMTDLSSLEVLLVYLDRQLTVKEAAAQLGWSVLKTYRTTRKLFDLGLLVISEMVSRKGKPLKKYTTPEECFFIPYHLTPLGTLEQLLDLLEKDARQVLFEHTARVFESEAGRKQQDVGLHLFRNGRGQASIIHSLWSEDQVPRGIVRGLLEPQATPLWNEWASLQLDHAQAKALQERLAALVREYAGEQGSGRYLLRVGLVPITE